ENGVAMKYVEECKNGLDNRPMIDATPEETFLQESALLGIIYAAYYGTDSEEFAPFANDASFQEMTQEMRKIMDDPRNKWFMENIRDTVLELKDFDYEAVFEPAFAAQKKEVTNRLLSGIEALGLW
ncbi:MAG: hypothetical protein IKS87_07590, partial [Lachnospiraceae bacterium]|nr:hypothetical protein [Lachnospiraceae bacterium]